MLADIGLGDVIWSLIILFLFVQYLIALFAVIVDLFRSDDLSRAARRPSGRSRCSSSR